jgi:hypothetical protein
LPLRHGCHYDENRNRKKISKLNKEILEGLKALDTLKVCNSLEVVEPNRRTRGFNVHPFVCAHPELPSVLGYARTARIHATHEPEKPMDVEGYYKYIAENCPLPSVAVIQDLDEIPGYGAFWGE